MTSLSLCMIVRDSSKTIEAALRSVKPWVDEMVVVDTGSADNTAEISAGIGATVYRFQWCDDFSAARNESIRRARGEWIFWMDSDDTIDSDNGPKLRQLVEQAPASTMGFVLQVHCPGPIEASSDVTIVDHVKLFQNVPQLRFEGRIHEQILPSIRRAGGGVDFTDVFVSHSGSDQSSDGRAKKRSRDLRLLKLELSERPDHTFTLFNIGMTLCDSGDYSGAIRALERSLSRADGESHVRKVYALLAGAHIARGEFSRAAYVIRDGLVSYPRDCELLFQQGRVAQHFGRLREAERAFLEVLEITTQSCRSPRRHFASIDGGISEYKAAVELAETYDEMGCLKKAEHRWRDVIHARPQCWLAWQRLAENLVEQDRRRDAHSLIEELRLANACAAESPAVLAGMAAAVEACGDIEEARRLLMGATELDPGNEEFLGLCARFLFDHGPPGDAEAILKRLVTISPQSGSAHHNLAMVYLRAGRIDEARSMVQKSLQLRPGYAATLALLNECQMSAPTSGEPK